MANKNNSAFMESLAIQKKAPYLYEVNYDDIDYSIGYDHYLQQFGGCSAVRNGFYYGRNYDWYYDECATFVVKCKQTKERHGSISISGGNTELTETFVDSGDYSYAYKYLPFHVLDGINDKGVIASVNVVPTGDKGNTTGTNQNGDDMCGSMLVRYILDYANSAEHAMNLISRLNIYMPIVKGESQELHWMIADKKYTFFVEIIDNQLKISNLFPNSKAIMTNFYLHEFDGNTSTAFYKKDNYDSDTTKLTAHANGVERYDLLNAGYNDASTKRGMIDLMKSVRYTKTYRNETSPQWLSEFCKDYGDDYFDLTIDSEAEDFSSVVDYCREKFGENQRDGVLWQTVHTSVYDIESKMLYLLIQEQNEEYEYQLTIEDEPIKNTNTTVQEVFDSFESSFQDKCIIPFALELEWLKKAVAEYCIEVDDIEFDVESLTFDKRLTRYAIDCLAQVMRVLYQERECSKINKRVSIVTKNLSIDGNGNSKAAAREELAYQKSKLNEMFDNQKPTAYV